MRCDAYTTAMWLDHTVAVDMLLASSGALRQNNDASLFQGMLSHAAAEEAGQLPQWLLQVLSQDERTGLLRLSIFSLAFTLAMAASVLPSICKLTMVDKLLHLVSQLFLR